MRAFSLETDPFPEAAARDFYFDTPALAAHMNEVLRGIASGHVLLVDAAGSGKSTALERFASAAGAGMRVFSVRAQSSHDARALSNAVVSALGLPLREPVAAELRDADAFLELLTGRSKRAVIVIDDAHRLERGALEQLLYLSKRWQRYDVRFLIAAEPALCERLDAIDASDRFMSRITRLAMPRLDEEQIGDYLNLCLFRAGLVGDSPFDAGQASRVAARAGGLVGAVDPVARELLSESLRDRPHADRGARSPVGRWPLVLAAVAALGTLATIAVPSTMPTAAIGAKPRSGEDARVPARGFRSAIVPRPPARAGRRRERSAAGALAGAP